MKQTFGKKIENISIEAQTKLEFENEIEPEKLSVKEIQKNTKKQIVLYHMNLN